MSMFDEIKTDIGKQKYLTVKETIELSGISRTTLWRLRRAGIGPTWFRMGGKRLMVRASELAAWLEDEQETHREH